MKIKNYDEVTSSLRPFLKDYLEERGIDTSKNFSCINPSHNDKVPSCNVMRNNPEIFHCFSCGGGTGDIFTACHYLENRPLTGKEFLADNLIYLAEKYNIEIDSTPLTEEELYEIDTFKAYRYAADYIAQCNNTEIFEQVLETREWKKDICFEYGIGTVDDYKKFREHLKGLGFAAGFLDDIDLSREDILNPNNLIFTIKDERGRPVGFSARNLFYTPDKQNGPKYNNSRTTGVKCNIYRKASRLYGMDKLVLKHSKKDVVYIVEGYADVITAVHEGITNCVGLMGSNFSLEQLYLLKDFGFYNICLMLDADETGQKKTLNILDTTLSNQRDLKVSVICLPEGLDPDDFLRTKGIRAFEKLKHWTAFEWRLNQFSEDTEPETICERMVPIIANETAAVQRDKLEKTLSKHTGLLVTSIHKDVERLLNSREMEKQRERQNILDRLRYNIERYPDNAETSISEAEGRLFELAKSYNEDSFSEEKYLLDLKLQKEEEETKDGSFPGFLLGYDLRPFEKALCGNWKKDVWGCIGGAENSGKSGILLKLLYSLVNIEENNATGIYHSIDDTKDQLIPRTVCLAEGGRKLTINKVIDPNYFIRAGLASNDILTYRDKGYDKLLTLGRDGRFIMKDANDGYTLSYAERLIRYYKEKYPNRNLVYVLDNFHKLQDFESIKGDERVRFKTMSTVMKNLATKHHICILSTVEYTKLPRGTVPSNTNVGETRQVAYDANLMCHIYSDLNEWGDDAKHYHVGIDGEGNAVKMPRIMLNFGKNKISSYKGRQWYDFFPEQADFSFVEASVVEETEKEKEEHKNRFEKIAENGLVE